MDEKLIEFANLLRQNGLRVSLSESMDSLHAVGLMGIADRQAFKDVLRSTMVKRAADVPTFDDLFELYFSGLAEILKAAGASVVGDFARSEEEFQRFLAEMESVLAKLNKNLSDLARSLLRNDTGQLERVLREAADQLGWDTITRPLQEGQFSHNLARLLGFADVAAELDTLKRELSESGVDRDLMERMTRYIDRRLQDLTGIIRSYVRAEREKRDYELRSQRLEALAEKSFFYLTEEEIRKMREAVAKLAQRLKNAISLKRKRARRGRFDLQDTLRANLQYGGVPFKIRFDTRKREKPRVVILCDVSDSVRNVSRFMLQFVYSIQDLYAKVRSFIFVSEVGEVTRLFEENDIHEAIDAALCGGIINVFAHSDFGRAFRTFHREYLNSINKKTTLIILGDARNNYNLPHEWTLRALRQRAKQVIWLNPESRLTWGFGDSEMDRYLPHCDLAEECRNLKQLYGVIDKLVAG